MSTPTKSTIPSPRDVAVAYGVQVENNSALERFLASLDRFLKQARREQSFEKWFKVERSGADAAGGGFFPLVVIPTQGVRDAHATAEAIRGNVGRIKDSSSLKNFPEGRKVLVRKVAISRGGHPGELTARLGGRKAGGGA